MQHEINRYPVRHPLLRNYIKFFWELHIDNKQLDHKLVPQQNINMRFNLNGTPQYLSINGRDKLLEDVFFSGLHDRASDASLKLNGKIDVLGICFHPDGFFPFLKIPVSEFKNLVLGADETGFTQASRISERLKEAPDVQNRMTIIEEELVVLLNNEIHIEDKFRQIFRTLQQSDSPLQLSDFCKQHQLNLRQLERLFNKYIGLPAKSYIPLKRFHSSMNQVLHSNYSRLSDIAYDQGYFDQMHFIRDFKRFTGDTPRDFVKKNNSILQIGKLS